MRSPMQAAPGAKGAVPAPAPPQQAMVQIMTSGTPGRTPEQLAAELRQAVETENNKKLDQEMEAARVRADKKDYEEMTGKDLDFDVKSFLTWGIVRKENIKVIDGFYVDMQSLTQRDRVVAEQLVKAKFGNLSATDNVYATALESAVLAMAITRVNNKGYEIPTMKLAASDPKVYATLFDQKIELYDTLLDSSEKLVGFLSVLYNKLEAADILKEVKEKVDVGKKSDAPSSPASSGSSAAS